MVVGRRSNSVRCTHCCGTAGRDVMFTIAPAIVSALLLGAFFVLLEAKAKPGELGDPSVWITQELSGKCDTLRHPRYPGGRPGTRGRFLCVSNGRMCQNLGRYNLILEALTSSFVVRI